MLRPAIAWQRLRDRSLVFWSLQLALVVITVATCLVSLNLHERRFSGFDVSPMIDGGWRVFLGQAAGSDFIGTFPPSLNLAVASAFRLFGVNWRAIGIAASLLTGILCLLGLRIAHLLRSTLGNAKCSLLSFVYVTSQLTTLIYINYLWHASMAQQIGMYAVLATFALLSIPASTHTTVELSLHLLLSLPLLLLSKPNTAFPAIALCFAALWVAKRSRVYVASLALGVLLLSSLLLHAAHSNLLQMLLSYKGLTGRLIPKPLFIGLFYNVNFGAAINVMAWLVLIPLLGLALPQLWRSRGALSPPFALLSIGSVAVSLIGFCTNFDFKITDAPLLLLGISLLIVSSKEPLATLTSKLLFTTVALALVGLFLGATRVRMQLMGQWGGSCGPQARITDSFFNNLLVCEAFPQTLAEVDHALEQLPPHPRVFFGSSFEFLYARQHLTPPRGLPVWWDPGTSHPLSASARIAQAWSGNHFDLLIFPRDAEQRMLPEIDAEIQNHYALISKSSNIAVYRRTGF